MRILLTIVFAISCAASPPVRRFTPMDTTQVTDVLHRQAEAWNRGDLAAYMEGYAKIDNLVFTSGGNVRKGWQVAFDHYQAKYGTDNKSMGHLVFGITQIDPVGADAAVILGTWTLTESDHPGKGVFSLVMERRPEGWRIIHDHTSVATP